jgi:uncharacterized protein DUF397
VAQVQLLQGRQRLVEVTDRIPERIAIRDSKLGSDSPILTVTTAQWRALLTAIRAGHLDTWPA